MAPETGTLFSYLGTQLNRQLKKDLDSYNEWKCPDNRIHTSFDFNVDLEELEQLDSVA